MTATLDPEAPTAQTAGRVRGLVRVAGGATLLDRVDLDLPAGRLVVVAGPSGAGKSTLLEALAGLTPPDAGSIDLPTVDGRAGVGFVPQADLLHRDLPLRRTLVAAALLRLDAPRREAEAVVDRVLETVGLADRADVAVGALSCGQRKRASLAVELLHRPSWCLLDEPTSGLDPSSARRVVERLRRLVDEGVSVVMTTHDPTEVLAADHLVVLGAGGRVLASDRPDRVLDELGAASVADLYDLAAVATAPVAAVRPATRRRQRRARGPRSAVGPVRQWRVLTARAAALLAANRLTLAVLVGAPVLVIAMMVFLFPKDALASGRQAETIGPQLVFWLAFCAFFFGLTDGLLQIVGEREIRRRERVAGVGTLPYLASKVGVLLPALAVVDLVLLVALRSSDRLPSLPTSTAAALVAALVATSLAGLALGLAASALVDDSSQATLALPMLCFPQVLFAGAVVPIDDLPAPLRWGSTLLATRWGFEALGRLLRDASAGTAGRVPAAFSGGLAGPLIALSLGTLGACALAARRLRS